MSVIERMLKRGPDGVPDLDISPMRRRDLKQGVLETEALAYPSPWSIGVFQFVKSAKWKVGEESAFRELGRLHDEHGVGGRLLLALVLRGDGLLA